MIRLDYRDARPIYEQLRDGLRGLMVSGALLPGEKLPSVRSLASSLAINPTTIQRAYEALEQEGYLRAEEGRGCFAAPPEQVESQRKDLLLQRLDETASELLFLGLTIPELEAHIRALAEREGNHDRS